MHVIRLHGPWMAVISTSEAEESRRIHLPRDWQELGEWARTAQISLSRRFHRPTGLTDSTRIVLVIPEGWPVARLLINGSPVEDEATVGDRRVFDISALIRAREAHDLQIEFVAGETLRTQPYLVAFEIEEPIA